MPYNLLVLPLIGGFIFISRFHYTRFAASKLSGQRLMLWAALAGVILAFFARVLVVLCMQTYPEIGHFWKAYFFHNEFSGTASLALILGIIAYWPLNLICNKDKASAWATRKYGSRLEVLFAESLDEEKQVMITLSDGKVYVGYVIYQPEELISEQSYFGILPTISGYRDNVTKKVNFITEYANIYQRIIAAEDSINNEMVISDFSKYFKSTSVETASVYDPDVYLRFGNDQETLLSKRLEDKGA